MRKINKIIIHVSDSTFGDVEVFKKWHTDKKPYGRGWSDVGYHYAVPNGKAHKYDEYDSVVDGMIQKGRPKEIRGAHARGCNKDSLGIVFTGLSINGITKRQENNGIKFIAGLIKKHSLGIDDVIGHCETWYEKEHGNKTCPNGDMDLFRDKLAQYIFPN